jgi:hypothetical protein
MKCEEFLQNLEQDSLTDAASEHLKTCTDCRAMQADLDAIHAMALEMRDEEIAPPDRIWISLRNQLEADGLIFTPAPVERPAPRGWWTVFQKPAFAGGFLAVILAAGAFTGFQGSLAPLQNAGLSAQQQIIATPSAVRTVKDELVSAVDDTVAGLGQEDPALTNSLRRNLEIVDNFIDVCEKSVREEPENQEARDYLNGAYEQKAELLATAMNHGSMGGLR